MIEFTKIPATKQSLAGRKLVHGVGVNDADYITRPLINGKRVTCPSYRRWKNMLKRAYCKDEQRRFPSYIGCTVCKEWLVFSVFDKWLTKNNVEGWHLDKDIKKIGNKEYSPDFCLLVPPEVNCLLLDRAAARGKLPIGVVFHKETGKFRARVGSGGKSVSAGLHSTPELAHLAYRVAKNKEILDKCRLYPMLAKHLMQHLYE